MEVVAKKRVSQQLVEFLLVVPFMVIILGILTEYAYALNINMTLSQGLKAVTSSYCSGSGTCYGIYNQISPTMTKSNIRDIVRAGFMQYLKDNNVPLNVENNIDVGYFTSGNSAVFMASYTYVPAFTLPNVYFKIMPDKFNFFATVSVPEAFLGDNSAYNSGVSSATLDNIWPNVANFNSESGFAASKKGILKNSENGRGDFVFLIPNPSLSAAPPAVQGDGPLTQPLSLVNWWGSVSTNAVDMATGKFYWWETIHVPQTCTDPIYDVDGVTVIGNTEPYDCSYNYIKTHDTGSIYSPTGQTIFVHDSAITKVSDIPGNWINSGAMDISPSGVTGALKRLVTLNSGVSSTGYYEPSINSSVGAQYKVMYSGSLKIICSPGIDNLSVIGRTCE